MNKLKPDKIKQFILDIRNERVILDLSVAQLYGVETKRINEAVKNNPEKFPKGYILKLTELEWKVLKSKISSSVRGGKVKLPAAFTEKGLYMLATILKSKIATQTTLAIIETFAKIRELSGSIEQLSATAEPEIKEGLIRRSGEIISDIIEDGMQVTNTETSVELNFAIVKFKHVVKRGKK